MGGVFGEYHDAGLLHRGDQFSDKFHIAREIGFLGSLVLIEQIVGPAEVHNGVRDPEHGADLEGPDGGSEEEIPLRSPLEGIAARRVGLDEIHSELPGDIREAGNFPLPAFLHKDGGGVGVAVEAEVDMAESGAVQGADPAFGVGEIPGEIPGRGGEFHGRAPFCGGDRFGPRSRRTAGVCCMRTGTL